LSSDDHRNLQTVITIINITTQKEGESETAIRKQFTGEIQVEFYLKSRDTKFAHLPA
jgi:uncharacterized membrane protein